MFLMAGIKCFKGRNQRKLAFEETKYFLSINMAHG